MTWTRDTPWRQGAFLSEQSLKGLYSAASAQQVAIAVSHSCDIANDQEKEPNVEFVLGRSVETADGNLTRAKNPRLLHLRATLNNQPQVIELSARDKFSIAKTDLAAHEPDEALKLETGELNILQSWLAARYKRQALPGALQDRLRGVIRSLEHQGKRNADGILGYWLDYQPREELPPGDPYELWISVVYTTDSQDSETSARQIAQAIEAVAGHATGIDLRECEAFSEEEFTARDVRTMVEYRLEHLSFATDPPGPTL